MQFRENTLEFNKKNVSDIFFTPKYQRDILFDSIKDYLTHEKNILIPGAGTGEFIYDILEMDVSHNIYAIENNESLFNTIEDISNVVSIFSDFFEISKPFNYLKYDIIISNPPSYIIDKTHPVGLTYKYLFFDKIDIYSFFLSKSIDLLKNDGILAFIIPDSILNHSSLQLLRNRINSTCNILTIKKLSNLFMKTTFNSVLIVLQKSKKDIPNNFICTINKNPIFTFDFPLYKTIFDNTTYLSKFNVEIFEGSNYTSDPRTSNNKHIPIIYTKNIDNDNTLHLLESKKQYIQQKNVMYKIFDKPALIFNKIYGDPDNEYNIHYALCTLPKFCCNTNTIVLQFPKLDNEEAVIFFHKIITSLKNEKTKLWAKTFLKFGYITPYQIQHYLPIFK